MQFYKRFADETLDENGTVTDFRLHYPENFNFAYDVVDTIAAEEPERRALVWCDPTGRGRIFPFSELSELSNKTANVLRTYGVRKGDRVLLMLKRHYQYWYILLALHKLGAVAIPATHMLTTDDLQYRINAVGVNTVIVTSDGPTADALDACVCPTLRTKLIVRGKREGYIDLDRAVEKSPAAFSRVQTLATDPMMLYFTSGTTGHPKAVLHDFTYPLCHIITAKHWQNVVDDGLHLSISDTGWGKASWGKIYGQWLCGAAVMVYDYDQFSPRKLMDIIRRYHVDTFCAPPTVYNYLVKRGIDPESFKSVCYAVTAGETLDGSIAKLFTEQTGLALHEGYGQTETTLLTGNLVGMPPRQGSLGKPSPLYDIRLLKPDGAYGGPGDEGEIVVIPKNGDRRQNGVFMGYCGDDEALDTVWRGGVYHTRDIARMDEDGYYWYISRTDDVIKSSGYRISPSEVETVLLRHPAVFECAVTGVPDLDRGQAIRATIVLSEGYEPTRATEMALKKFMSTEAASYKRPKQYDFVSEMPRTISGKIRRVALREAK
ncbi:MAG: AMP-binding protein [Oscillospiraceae bacterium]|nr:AMP-binding protein [Oscillospiraceae bacterium]